MTTDIEQEPTVPTDEVDSRMLDLRARIESARDAVASAEEAAKGARNALAQLEQGEAVELMRSLDTEEYTFTDGAKIKREQKVYCSITEENRKEAHLWLKKNGHGSLIKSRASIEFARNEQHLATVLQAFCDKMIPEREVTVSYGNTPLQLVTAIDTFIKESFPEHKLEIEETIHSTTLRSFVTKMLRQGLSLPPEFKVFAPQVATLSLPDKAASF
jgi:hypothetical protein